MSRRIKDSEIIIKDESYLELRKSVADDLDYDFVKTDNLNKFNKGSNISDELLEEAIYHFHGNKTLIIKNVGIARQTLYSRIAKSPKLQIACENSLIQTTELVESKLMLRIKGYDAVETKAFCVDGKIITQNIIKHYPPSVEAINSFFNRNDVKKQQEKTFEDFVREVNMVLDNA